MILKIWNEVTQSWVFVDNVKNVSTNHDYVLRMEDDSSYSVEAVLKVYKPVDTDKKSKSADLLKGSWIPWYNASAEVKNCPDFYLSRNVNVQCTISNCFVLPNKNYQDRYDLTFNAKVLLVNTYNSDDNIKSSGYLLPENSDVYLLNDNGKTIDRI